MASTINASTGPVSGLISTGDNSGVIELQSDGVTKMTVSSTGVSLPALAGPAVIEANSSSDALRITQTGAGNALVVEDSANPDATPFVVDSSGNLISGQTSVSAGYGYTPKIQNIGATVGNASMVLQSTDSSVAYPILTFGNASSSNTGVVSSGNILGQLRFYGGDGTNPVRGAAITSEVDGTPGSNDMPGRLVFATTADGASSPTERMRIDNAGRVVVGGAAATTGQSFRVRNNITGSVNSSGIVSQATIQSDVTGSGLMFSSYPSTADAAFTLSNLVHYDADQGTITGGSRTAPTAQYGFRAASSLTGAANNYGFYSNIASGSGRWNFYANGTATNYFGGDTIINGKVGIGTAGSPSYGTSGQVLTSNGSGSAPSWQSPAGGGSWVYLGQVNPTGSTYADITGFFDSTYQLYVITMGMVCTDNTNTQQFYCRFFLNGSVYSGSSYAYNNSSWIANANQFFNGRSEINFNPQSYQRADGSFFLSGMVYVPSPTVNGYKQIYGFINGIYNPVTNTFGASEYQNGGQLTGLRFYFQSGNFGSNGATQSVFRVYGIKNS